MVKVLVKFLILYRIKLQMKRKLIGSLLTLTKTKSQETTLKNGTCLVLDNLLSFLYIYYIKEYG